MKRVQQYLLDTAATPDLSNVRTLEVRGLGHSAMTGMPEFHPASTEVYRAGHQHVRCPECDAWMAIQNQDIRPGTSQLSCPSCGSGLLLKNKIKLLTWLEPVDRARLMARLTIEDPVSWTVTNVHDRDESAVLTMSFRELWSRYHFHLDGNAEGYTAQGCWLDLKDGNPVKLAEYRIQLFSTVEP